MRSSAAPRRARPTRSKPSAVGSAVSGPESGSGDALDLASSRALLPSVGREGAASAPSLSSRRGRSIPENGRLLKWLLAMPHPSGVSGARPSGGPWDRLVELPGVEGKWRTMVSVPGGGFCLGGGVGRPALASRPVVWATQTGVASSAPPIMSPGIMPGARRAGQPFRLMAAIRKDPGRGWTST